MDEELKPRDWNEGFGDNAGHGADEVPCTDCKYRKIIRYQDGTVIDTGKGATCKMYPVLKPMEVMSDGAACPKYKKDEREKNL